MFTNCELFHCSMLRHEETLKSPFKSELADHLNITEKAKYPKIAQDVDICTPLVTQDIDLCPHYYKCQGA